MRPSAIRWRLCLCIPVLLSVLPAPLLAQPGPSDEAPGIRTVEPTAWLLEQVRLGEARHNEAIVEQALDRLAAIAPDDPRVLEARVRQALRAGNTDAASRLVTRLQSEAPDSEAYRLARLNLSLALPEQSQALNQARLMAAAGRLEEAEKAYSELFADGLPTLPLALEYWQFMARLPGGTARATQALEALDAHYPESPELGFSLARLLFSADRDDQALDRLARLAEQPGSHLAAARQWRDALTGEPASEASVAAWQRFLELFGDTEYAEDARQTLTRHRQLLADPAYQARLRGLARLERQGDTSAESDIRRALEAYPEDAELIGALGVIRLRQGRHGEALKLFQQAKGRDISGFSGDKWEQLIDTARYWQALRRGDAALARDNLDRAEQAYRNARRLAGSEPQAWLGLGDVALRRDNPQDAEHAWRQALRLAPSSSAALRRLAALHAKQSPQHALNFIDGLPSRQQAILTETRARLQATLLRNQGEQMVEAGQWSAAVQRFASARELAPDDIWLAYALARALEQQKQREQADAVFDDLLIHLTTPEETARGRYARALYLAGTDRNTAALDTLDRIPETLRNADVRSLSHRLERAETLARAERLYTAGNAPEARRLLTAQPAHADIERRLGSWALTEGDLDAAARHYRQALTLAPGDVQAQLGLADTALARNDRATARQRLADLPSGQMSLNARRHEANLWAALGETARAEQLMSVLLERPGADEDAPLLRDAARIAEMRGDTSLALARYRHAMRVAELTDTQTLASNTGFTRQMRAHADDDWLAASLRSEAAALYQSRNTRVHTERRIHNDSGTDGVSSLTTTIDMLEIDTPLGAGRGFARIEHVDLDAGRPDRDADGLSREAFGTCAVAGCDAGHQQDSGASLGLGWYNETWRVDLGTTPLGFAITDWVGGLQYVDDVGPLWMTASLSRRPLNDSLLAYAGARDPRTGITWGGVRATGASLGLGYDQGGPYGAWSSLGIHHLSGENVPDNTRMQLMGGGYRKLINTAHQRLSVGLGAMAMHYDRELGGYSLGQGGYYSPQRYVSLSLPVSYMRRTTHWSWLIEGSVSHSWTDSDDSARYPVHSERVSALPDATATRTGGNGGGFGLALSGRVERRLGDHWSAGLGFALQQAEGYSPNMLSLSLRYHLSAWQGDMAMPPEALTPYAEFE